MASPTMSAEPTTKLWANSGDSHYLEPDGLWDQILPKHLAERMPHTEHISDTEEIVHVDGQSFPRQLPRAAKATIKGEVRGEEIEGTLFDISHRPAGSRDPQAAPCRSRQRGGLGRGDLPFHRYLGLHAHESRADADRLSCRQRMAPIRGPERRSRSVDRCRQSPCGES